MQKSLAELPKFLFSIAFIIIVIGSYVIVAQTPITGEWKANTRSEKKHGDLRDSVSRTDGKIHISFERSRGDNRRSQHGSSFAYSELQGLTADQTQNGPVRFRLVREAGTVEAEGTFVNGKGSGTFTFIPDQGYLGAMTARGFDFARSSSKHPEDASERQFSAALLNVTTALADDLEKLEQVLDNENVTPATFRRTLQELGASVVQTYPYWSVANWKPDAPAGDESTQFLDRRSLAHTYRLDQHRAGFRADRVAQLVHVAEGDMVEALGDRAGALQVLGIARRRQGGEGPPMERPGAGNHPHLLRMAADVVVAARQLQGAFDGLGPGVAEEHLVGEGMGDQPLGKAPALRDLVEVGDVPQLGALLLQRLHQVGVGVAERVHRDARREVEESSPVRREEIGAFAALESEVGARIGLHQGVAHEPTPITVSQ